MLKILLENYGTIQNNECFRVRFTQFFPDDLIVQVGMYE